MFCCAGQVGLQSLPEGADLSAKRSEWVGLGVAWQGGRWKVVGRTAGALQPWSRACWRARASFAPGVQSWGGCPPNRQLRQWLCVPCACTGSWGESGAQTTAAPWPSPAAMCDNLTHPVSGSLGPMCLQRWASWPAPLEPQGGAGPLRQWGGPKATSLLQAMLQTTGSIPASAISSNHGGGAQSPHPSGCSSRFSQLQTEGAHLAMTGASSRAEIHDVDAGTGRSSGACPPAFHGARGRRHPA